MMLPEVDVAVSALGDATFVLDVVMIVWNLAFHDETCDVCL